MLIIDSSIFVGFLSFSYREACFQNILLPFHEKEMQKNYQSMFQWNFKKFEQSKIVKYSELLCKLNLVSILTRQHNFQCSQTGCIGFSIGHHKCHLFPKGIYRGAEIKKKIYIYILFSNLNNFFFLGFLKNSELSKLKIIYLASSS